MNRDYVLFHLAEAAESLTEVVESVTSDPTYDRAELAVNLKHVYHHLNTAWNARDVSKKHAKECSEQDFYTWRVFPKDMDMSV